MILSGDKDIELAKRMSKKWHDSEPTSEFQVIENAGHYANMDNANKFNRIVLSFVKQIGNGKIKAENKSESQ